MKTGDGLTWNEICNLLDKTVRETPPIECAHERCTDMATGIWIYCPMHLRQMAERDEE